MAMKQASNHNSTIRIIAGRWRGRNIVFNDRGGVVRPTPNRIRETLFNWLTPYIAGAKCLDLYAGTGVLGFEALSRNAAAVVAVEQQQIISKNILANKQLLGAELEVVQADVVLWLAKIGIPYDIIFLDPPYKAQSLPYCFQLLAKNNWLKPGSLLYYEHNTAISEQILPVNWQVLKAKVAGMVHYYLAQVKR